MSKEKKNLQIHETTEYSQFELLDENRDRDINEIKRLQKKIEQDDLLSDYPALVTQHPKKKKLVIIDGQKRFLAAKSLKKIFYYKFSDNPRALELIAESNSLQDRWLPKDYLKHYCAKGIDSYCRLKEYQKNWNVPLTVVLDVFTNRDKSMHLKDGKFVLTPENEEFGLKVWGHLQDFRKDFAFWHNSYFIRAVKKLLHKEKYDANRMRTQLKKHLIPLDREAYTKAYINRLEDIYNAGRRDKVFFSNTI